jgi:16S rRNA (uracil1498-N3)-methyltransferase
VRSLASDTAPQAVSLIVGPEGGWSSEEVREVVTNGFLPITLGPLTLRAEAVPLAALSALTVIWD